MMKLGKACSSGKKGGKRPVEIPERRLQGVMGSIGEPRVLLL
jgi:hypothetical protein